MDTPPDDLLRKLLGILEKLGLETIWRTIKYLVRQRPS